MPHSYHLPPPDPTEDQPAADLPTEEQPPPTVHTKEHQVPTASIPTPLHTAHASFAPPKPSALSTTAPIDSAGPSTSAPPSQHITISTRDFLAIMDAVRAFSVTSASFATAHATLVERMTHIEAAMAQNQAILMPIQSHLGLPPISPSVPAKASSVPPPAGLAPIAPLDLLAAIAVTATLLVAPHHVQGEDDSPPATQ